MTQTQVVVTWEIIGDSKFVVVLKVIVNYGVVAVATTTTVHKLASSADAGVLAAIFAALETEASALAVEAVAPLASSTKTFALVAFALLALAVAVALETLTLVTAHQFFHAEKTTVRAVKLTKGIQVDVIRHDIKRRVPNRQQVVNQSYNSITYFIIINKSIFFEYSI